MTSTGAARLRQGAAQQADSVLTLYEASKRLKVSERTLWALAKDNEVPHFKVGRQYRFLVSATDWRANIVRDFLPALRPS